jgi:membrane-associated protease RseP (regulator of RpoE activity)
MLTVIGWVLFLLALMISIGLHECGHLVPAKKFGVRVSQYMIGFGPTLWSRKRGETEFGLKAIPLGGYIRMIGMFPPNPKGEVDASSLSRTQTLVESLRADSLAEIHEGEASRAFYNLSVPKKLTIMAGGPVTNLLLSIVLFTVAFSVIGNPATTTTVASVVACVPTAANPEGLLSTDGQCHGSAKTAALVVGMKPGDRLLTINAKPITAWPDLGAAIRDREGKMTEVSFRSGSIIVIKQVVVSTLVSDVLDANGKPTGAQESRGFLGVSPEIVNERQPLGYVLPQVGSMIVSSVKALGQFPAQVFTTARQLFSSEKRSPNGPVSIVGIGQITGEIASAPNATLSAKAHDFLMLIASVNLFLFLFNMVPILPLDGGHIGGALYEGTRRVVARLRRKPRPGPVDTAKMWPLAYTVTLFLIAMSLVTVLADIIKPIG